MSDRPYIYLDHAAATPVAADVRRLMQPYLAEYFYNPSATYLPARGVREDLEQARARIAHWFGARPSEIIFTAGGSEANNLAIHGVMRRNPAANIVVSAVEHESVLAPAAHYEVRHAAVRPDGVVNLENLASLIDDNTALVSVMYANNEIGTIMPITEIAALVAEKRAIRQSDTPLYLHVDACQAANYLDLHAARLGADLMTINGGKLYGPKQSGALYIKAAIALEPLVDGGGQEFGLRSGTENVAGSIGLGAALDAAQTMRHEEVARLQTLQKRWYDELASRIPEAVINGSTKKRLPNNVHITLPGLDNERVLLLLEQSGILAAAGSACSASNEQPSHVLSALGLSDADAQASLRFTMGRSTTSGMVTQTVQTLKTITDTLQK